MNVILYKTLIYLPLRNLRYHHQAYICKAFTNLIPYLHEINRRLFPYLRMPHLQMASFMELCVFFSVLSCCRILLTCCRVSWTWGENECGDYSVLLDNTAQNLGELSPQLGILIDVHNFSGGVRLVKWWWRDFWKEMLWHYCEQQLVPRCLLFRVWQSSKWFSN